MCLSNICIQLWVMEMRLLDSSALPPELWSCEPRYVKVSTNSTLLPPTCTNVPGNTVVSVVWILVFAQLIVTPRGFAWVSQCLLKQRMMEVVVTTGTINRAKLQSNYHQQQTNTQFFYRPDALPVTQPTVSKHWREKYHNPWTCLPQAHLGVFKLCLWPLIAPGYLGEGCHDSHQPSDASTPFLRMVHMKNDFKLVDIWQSTPKK